jgi:hypothetical protein
MLNYLINISKEIDIHKYHGYFKIMSTDKTLSTSNVLESYRKRDAIEK